MSKVWDVIVVGGGPAGMMAAGTAAKLGKSTLIVEKNNGFGKKLLITGGGRCNLTNNKDTKELVASYRNTPKALFSTFSEFDVSSTLDFFHGFGMPTKEEDHGRIFPKSNSAESVWQVMLDYMDKYQVRSRLSFEVKSIAKGQDGLFKVVGGTETLVSRSCVIATGGTSRPETGSTGAGFKWLSELGHTVKQNNFALVPIKVAEPWISEISGLSFDKVGIEVLLDNVRRIKTAGKILFTHVGLSGPGILNLSSQIGELLPEGEVQLGLDLLPEFDQGELKQNLQDLLLSESNKFIKNSLSSLVPSRIVPVLLNQSKIDPDTPNHSVTKQQRKDLRLTLKHLPLTVDSLLGADKAVVSSGGVSLNEVNMKTMESRLVESLFVVGDVLDIDRPSGGYSLQLCWSTGYIAGKCA